MAEAANGAIYIADAGGQRIRKLNPNGVVQTIAGSGETNAAGLWVEGGYRDGPVSRAKFNHPSAVAIGPDGALYVADTLNHCIRKISDNRVATFAGRIDSAGAKDGSRDSASFQNPRALVFDHDGTLYVVDAGVGLRRISPGGTVTTVALPADVDRRLGGLAIVGAGSQKMFLLSSFNSLVALNAALRVQWVRAIAPPKTGTRLFGDQGELRQDAFVASRQPFGQPFALAALDARTVLYSDIYTHVLWVAHIDASSAGASIVSAPPPVDASNRFGGYRDGPLDQARFDAPMALLHRRDGRIVVADSGNRRLREFRLAGAISRANAALDDRLSQYDSQSGLINLRARLVPQISSRYYRIAIFGNSYTYWDTRWNESIGGLLERRLNAATLGRRAKPIKVITLFPYFETFSSVLSYAHEVLSQHIADSVLWQINEQTVAVPYLNELAAQASPGKPIPQIGADFARIWKPRLIATLTQLQHELRRRNIRFFAVLHPIPSELTPLESAELEEYEEPYYPTNSYQLWSRSGISQQLHDAVRSSGVPYLDLYPPFFASERSPMRQPLFGTQDQHFSLNGRMLTAQALAQLLKLAQPWKSQPASTDSSKPST
ncbi:MAG: hypothetical protein JOZ97_06820 [Candidatus Eremiobacteraeota bacterium]|nr:hypothetical protein [Candidatus Eremiobacteraeota bacterium]